MSDHRHDDIEHDETKDEGHMSINIYKPTITQPGPFFRVTLPDGSTNIHVGTCPDYVEEVAAGATLDIIPDVDSGEHGWIHQCIDVGTVAADAAGVSIDPPTRGTGAGTPVASSPSSSEPCDEAYLVQVLDAKGFGSKFDVNDVTVSMAAFATEWAKNYEGDFEFMLDMKKAATTRRGGLSTGQAKGTLNCWRADYFRKQREAKEAEKAAAPSSGGSPVTEDGMYLTPDGTVYKVQVAHHGSGNLYAKRLVVEDGTGSFEYERGGLRKLRAEWKMTLEQAKKFGQLYGICCVCSAVLTNETSIAEGIGPVCAGRWS